MHPRNLRESIATTIKLAGRAAPAAALVSGLLGPSAWGAPGDLDPSFADVGRAYPLPDLYGAAWSIQPQGDDDFIVAGGDYYDSYYYDTLFVTGFAERLSSSGSIDQTFSALTLAQTEVFDLAVQEDGKAIGVGRTLQDTPEGFVLTIFRLVSDGTLDPTFGAGGLVRVESQGLAGAASSVVLEPDGRIVVAGVRHERLIVLRLLSNGDFDETFGDSGVFTGVDNISHFRPRILRVADGGYRVTSPGIACQVLGLTASGTVDESFGASGLAGLDVPSTCSSMAAQADGRLLVAGQGDSQGFAIRLLASGERDATFDASAVADAMEQATALDVSASGSIFVAGRGAAGVPATALVMRLQPNGALDTTFGVEGSTLIDLPFERGTSPAINDITVKGDKVLVAGGDEEYLPRRGFVARLLADDGTHGPGVLGIVPPFSVDAKEQDGEAVVTVRRTGGRAGRVSVLVQTRSVTARPATEIATAGGDFVTTSGTLTWEDGDVGSQQIVIPILPDAAGAGPEECEVFEVALSDLQGDAGLGTWTASVTIAADGEPAGQFSIEMFQSVNIDESQGHVDVHVSRNYYYAGAVSVTVSSIAGTAAARRFRRWPGDAALGRRRGGRQIRALHDTR